MMAKAQMPSEKEVKHGFENPGDGTYDGPQQAKEKPEKATDQPDREPKESGS